MKILITKNQIEKDENKTINNFLQEIIDLEKSKNNPKMLRVFETEEGKIYLVEIKLKKQNNDKNSKKN